VKILVGSLLNLMEDPDKDVRVAFSDCIKNILESLDSEDGFIKEVNSCLVLVVFPDLLWFLFHSCQTLIFFVLFSCVLAVCFTNERGLYKCQNIKK